MTTAKKTKKPVAKKATKKKKAATKTELPAEAILPRGQMRLPNGDIRLKSGNHDLGKDVKEFDVAGAKIKLSGKVLIANKNVDWLSIGKCQKCSTPRPTGVTIHRAADGMVLLTYTCSNKKECDLGDHTYVQVHEAGRFLFAE